MTNDNSVADGGDRFLKKLWQHVAFRLATFILGGIIIIITPIWVFLGDEISNWLADRRMATVTVQSVENVKPDEVAFTGIITKGEESSRHPLTIGEPCDLKAGDFHLEVRYLGSEEGRKVKVSTDPVGLPITLRPREKYSLNVEVLGELKLILPSDEDGNVRAEVKKEEETIVSLAGGKSSCWLAPGNYSVVCFSRGSKFAVQPAHVKAAKECIVDVSAQPVEFLWKLVWTGLPGGNGQEPEPIEGVDVTLLESAPESSQTVTTGNDGLFRFWVTPDTGYPYRAEKNRIEYSGTLIKPTSSQAEEVRVRWQQRLRDWRR